MYTRLSLSEDPKAVEMKKNIEQSVVIMGFPAGTDIGVLFDGMQKKEKKNAWYPHKEKASKYKYV